VAPTSSEPTGPAAAGGPAAEVAEVPEAPPTIRPLRRDGLAVVAGELAELYGLAYAGPPWSEGPDGVARYRDRLATWAGRNGFAGLLARRDDGLLAGAAYGWWGPPAIDDARLPGVAAGVERVFHVGDLMVHPAAERRGLGRRLLDQLVAGRAPCVLLTHPDPHAWRLYESAGWRRTGTIALVGAPSLLVYALA
jgi:ribosomal protein S18 acetylase RimI-like enzyme